MSPTKNGETTMQDYQPFDHKPAATSAAIVRHKRENFVPSWYHVAKIAIVGDDIFELYWIGQSVKTAKEARKLIKDIPHLKDVFIRDHVTKNKLVRFGTYN
jgi:hypothetical protein